MVRPTAHLLAWALSLSVGLGWGQTPAVEQATPVDTVLGEAGEPALLELSSAELAWLDYLGENWCFSSDTSLLNIHNFEEGETPALDTAALQARLGWLDSRSPLDLAWNPVVHSRIAFYASKRKKHLGTMLGRAPGYFPLFEETLDRHGLPLELKYLAVVESGLNPMARSHAGARGLWQFMYCLLYTSDAADE